MSTFNVGDEVMVRGGVPGAGRVGTIVLRENNTFGVVFQSNRRKLETFLPHELCRVSSAETDTTIENRDNPHV